jgi:hypothetical protein
LVGLSMATVAQQSSVLLLSLCIGVASSGCPALQLLWPVLKTSGPLAMQVFVLLTSLLVRLLL